MSKRTKMYFAYNKIDNGSNRGTANVAQATTTSPAPAANSGNGTIGGLVAGLGPDHIGLGYSTRSNRRYRSKGAFGRLFFSRAICRLEGTGHPEVSFRTPETGFSMEISNPKRFDLDRGILEFRQGIGGHCQGSLSRAGPDPAETVPEDGLDDDLRPRAAALMRVNHCGE